MSRARYPGSVAATLVALAIIAAACDSTAETTTTTIVTGTTTAPATETTPAPEPDPPPEEELVYRIGLPGIGTQTNFWRYYGPDDEGITRFMTANVFEPTKPAMFRIMYPGIVVAPDVASGKPVEAVEEGDVWTVTQPIRDDYTWSDGTLLTADDVVFTFETVRDAELCCEWPFAYPYTEDSTPRLLSVEALDDWTVKYTFDAKPGAAAWPHTVGVAPIMPKAPWERLVAEALQNDDPAAVLYESDPFDVGDLSGGPMVYSARNGDESIENVRNDYYANEGFTHQFWDDGSYALNGELLYGDGDGDPIVEYTEGPFFDRTIFTILSSGQGQQGFSITERERALMLALIDGEIDYMIQVDNPDGTPPDLRRLGLEAEHLAATVNPLNAFAYLAFNLRRSPGKFLGFRQAMAYFDKENLASNALQGAFLPSYVLVPEGNRAWYDEEAAEAIAGRYVGLGRNERIAAAYAALESDGFTWETPAVFDDEGSLVSPGSGIIDPEGNPVPEVTIIGPGPDSIPAWHITALWLEDWGESLGIPVEANPADFSTIIASVWPGVGQEPPFDMYILQWGLGNPAWPDFHEDFFHSKNLAEVNDGSNTTGYSNPEFDALADAMLTETDQAAAYNLVWQMEQMIADDLPYVPLLIAPLTEFYSKDLQYPFTQTLGGIVRLHGMPGTVSK